MTSSPDTEERFLAQRFAQLRAVESRTAPPLPEVPEVVAHSPHRSPLVARTAAAFAVSLAASVLVMVVLPERQSPQALYLDIMQSSVLITDDLLRPSDSLVPELHDLPAYEPVSGQDMYSEFK
tara:strand:- start:2636 stop:3004 length:369 start_codon:yes stop_codon:yes gene_type:complete